MKSDITIIVPLDPKKEISKKELNIKEYPVIIEKGNNPSANRNLGIKKAKTTYVAFINAHTIVADSWMSNIQKFFLNYPQIDIVGGPQLTHQEESFFAKTSGYALSSVFGAANVSSRYKSHKINLNADETVLTSANLICKKEVFNKVKFDESIYPGEDPKFISDAKKAGFKIAYNPDIIVFNKRRTSILGLAKQMFNYGFVRPKKESFLETLKKPFFLIPSLFLVYLLLMPTLWLILPYLILPLAAYLILNTIFSFYESWKNKTLFSMPLLFVIFPTIHISYGFGFLLGSINNRHSS